MAIEDLIPHHIDHVALGPIDHRHVGVQKEGLGVPRLDSLDGQGSMIQQQMVIQVGDET